VSENTTLSARLGRWLPVIIGLGFAGLGLGALGVAAEDLTISPPQPPASGPSELALLSDEVSVIQRDVLESRDVLGKNLEALAQYNEEGAAARHAESQAELRRLAQRLESTEQRVVELQDELDQLRAAGPVAAAPRESPDPQPEPAEPRPEPRPVARVEPEPAPEPAPAPRRGLFTFQAPEGGVPFDQRLRFSVIASLSRVGFDAKSTLHDFSGVTSDVSGSLVVRLGAADEGAVGRVAAQAATLITGVEGRDEEMRKALETGSHPTIEFSLTGFHTTAVDPDAQTLTGDALGTMTIHGVTREVRVPVNLAVDSSRRLELTGEVFLNMSDYGIEPPGGGPVTVEDQVKVWLSLRLRSLGPAGEE
jgi:polyisoprenoid-binding protein YceI